MCPRPFFFFGTWQEYPDNQEGLTPSASPAAPESEIAPAVPSQNVEPNDPLPHANGAEAPCPEPTAKPLGEAAVSAVAESAQAATSGQLMNGVEAQEPENAAVPEPDQKASQSEQALEPQNEQPAVEPADQASVDTQIQPAVEVALASAPPAEGPPDRTLELAGLQALMKNQETRLQIERQNQLAKAKQVKAEQGFVVHTPKVEVNWTSHKKEGMRLKRLMEESSDGAKFPHMQKLWNGTAAVPWLVFCHFSPMFGIFRCEFSFDLWDVLQSLSKKIRTESSSCSNGWHPTPMPSQLRLIWCSPNPTPISTGRRGSSSRPRRCSGVTSRWKKSVQLLHVAMGCRIPIALGSHL